MKHENNPPDREIISIRRARYVWFKLSMADRRCLSIKEVRTILKTKEDLLPLLNPNMVSGGMPEQWLNMLARALRHRFSTERISLVLSIAYECAPAGAPSSGEDAVC